MSDRTIRERPSLRERAAASRLRDWWERKSDAERRKIVQGHVDTLDGDFSPDAQTLVWLLDRAGISAPGGPRRRAESAVILCCTNGKCAVETFEQRADADLARCPGCRDVGLPLMTPWT